MPLSQRYVAEAEWQEVGSAALRSSRPASGDRPRSAVEVAMPEEVAMMFGELRTPVKAFWRLIGKRKYRGYTAPVRDGQVV